MWYKFIEDARGTFTLLKDGNDIQSVWHREWDIVTFAV